MFQDFSAKALSLSEPDSTVPRPLDEMRELVARYPNLTDVELARLIHLYRGMSALEVAFMLSDEQLAPPLDQFWADHRRKLRTPFRQYAALVGYAAIAVAAVAWAAIVSS